MTLDEIKALNYEIEQHRRMASNLRGEQAEVAELRKSEGGFGHQVKIGLTTCRSGIDTERKSYICHKDAIFRRIWEKHMPDMLRLVEMDLAEQARTETVTADLLQSKFNRIMTAAAIVEDE